MKVAIITLHRVYNYGSVLQAYATQTIFEREGLETYIIDYITPQRTKKQIIKTAAAGNNKGMFFLTYKFLKIVSVILKEMTFGKFVEKNLHLTRKYITAEDLELDPPLADIYVTGSDQTWNSAYNGGVDRGFFLNFVPEGKTRIAFVASFGKRNLETEEVIQTIPYICKYKKISVRENSGLMILQQLGRYDGIQLIDPTLQLSREEWMRIASPRLVKEPYIILMLLYNEDNNATEYARRIADQKGFKLVKISWELKKPPMIDKLFTHRTPADFLSLFAYADFVVTNSFHGVAFSINLERQFIAIPRNEFNSRIESLLCLTGLENRMIIDEKQLNVVAQKINYTPIREILKKERERANKFIKECLC